MTASQDQLLKDIVAKTLGIATVPANLSQKNCDKWDSVSQLNLIVAIEAAFGVEFAPEEIASMRDLATLSATLAQKLP